MTDTTLPPQDTAMPADGFTAPPTAANSATSDPMTASTVQSGPIQSAAQSLVAAPSQTTSLRSLAAGVALHNGALAPQNMAELITFSELMSRAGPMVGKAFRGNPGACLGIIMQAMRWKMDPFAVSQKAYVTKDKAGEEVLGYEAQLVAAVILANSPIVGRPQYAYTGAGLTRRCTISAVLRGDPEPKTYTTPEAAPIGRSPLWQTDLDQQLGYYAMRAWARKHCPDIIMGVYAIEEFDDGRAIEATAREVRAVASTARASVFADLTGPSTAPQIDYDADQRTPDSEIDGVARIIDVDVIEARTIEAATIEANTIEIGAPQDAPTRSDGDAAAGGCFENTDAPFPGAPVSEAPPLSDPLPPAATAPAPAATAAPVIEDVTVTITLASDIANAADARQWFALYRTMVSMAGSQAQFDKMRKQAVDRGQIGALYDHCEETYEAMIRLHTETEMRFAKARRAKSA